MPPSLSSSFSFSFFVCGSVKFSCKHENSPLPFNVARNVEGCIQVFSTQSDSLPLKQSNSSSIFESAVVTSSTAIGNIFSCEAPYTANAKDGSLASRNSDKKKKRNKVKLVKSRLILTKIFHFLLYYVRTFNNVLLDVQDVELAGAIDHVILAEMDAVTWLACLDLLRINTGTHCIQKANHEKLITDILSILYTHLRRYQGAVTKLLWEPRGLMVSAPRSGFEAWQGTLCRVLRQDTSLSQRRSSPRRGGPCDEPASHPGGGGGVEITLAASCYRNRDKLRADGPHFARVQAFVTLLSRTWRVVPVYQTKKCVFLPCACKMFQC